MLEGSTRPGEARSRLSESQRRSGRDLEPFGAVERPVDSAVAPASCKGRAGGERPGTAHKGAGRLASPLAMLRGGFGATAERQGDAGRAAGACRGRQPHSGDEILV